MSGFSIETKPRLYLFGLITLMTAFILTNAQAAVLSSFEGDVSVNRGNGFQPVSLGAVLDPGYRLRTGEGTATIRYDNGCTTTVAARQTVVVSSRPPVCGAVGGMKDEATVAPEQEYGIASVAPAEAFIVGGVIAGSAGLAIALTNRSHGGSEGGGVSP